MTLKELVEKTVQRTKSLQESSEIVELLVQTVKRQTGDKHVAMMAAESYLFECRKKFSNK